LQADLLQPATWERELDELAITHVVHGAALTPTPEQEMAQPRHVLEVNLNGTIHMLEWARRKAGERRFIFASSGAVYAADEPHGLVPEETPLRPSSLYAISKVAGELITQRYQQCFGLDTASVRFSGVYGPMDRETPARQRQSALYRLAHLALYGERISLYEMEGGGDWIHAWDVAVALTALLDAAEVRHPVYNIACGRFATLAELAGLIQELLPDMRYEVASNPEAANVVAEARQRHGRWGAYDISRMRNEFGWQPRPLRVAVHAYIHWLQAQRQRLDWREEREA
jgi:UDP-glucose 4-epimerase